MKSSQAWNLGMKDVQTLIPSHRSHLKKPTWIIVLVLLVCFFLVCAELNDDEIASPVVIRDILTTPPVISTQPRIAFLLLTPGALPFKRWDNFFQGHEGKFFVCVQASKDKPVHFSHYFLNREICSDEVTWGKLSMVNAEGRLLGNALKDPDNQHFVLLSDSCVPLRNFDYAYNYLMYTNVSFVDCFEDPGPHGSGRHIQHMLPEVEKRDFQKGSQPRMEGGCNCYFDEHYLPTFFYNRASPFSDA